MLIQRAVLLDGAETDIRVEERIVEVGDLAPHRGELVLDAAGQTVIPGLHDHHVHLRSAAAALTSARVGPAEVRGRDDLARALADAGVGGDGWIRAVGYHEAVAGPLDRDVLDEVSPPVPVRVQHRSGVLWTLNSAGLARVGLTDHLTGGCAAPTVVGQTRCSATKADWPTSADDLANTASPASPTRRPTSRSVTS